MRVYTFFGLLIFSLALGVAGTVGMKRLLSWRELPSGPCSSVIENGDFVADDLQRYIFNGSVTFWLDERMVSIFGMSETPKGKTRVRRVLHMGQLNKAGHVVTGKVDAVDLSPSDDIGGQAALFSARDESLNLVFRRIRARMYLVTINDNWIMMCEEK
ncbi:hypothetical protein [Serratia proteamaculans]|uniref:Uncharacterized protein n=1 Tax=Serratia proteamaculans TaxID=28151 RepID=A0A5Q2VEJ6_SERPR|nr:hypothetical protein [Serratia proteamaculans]QGH61991.1 hypothetical protein GHV41_14670 [Serratia proteamaculans]